MELYIDDKQEHENTYDEDRRWSYVIQEASLKKSLVAFKT